MTDPSRPGARLLSAQAHGLRNHLAAIRSVVRLIDEPDVAEALDEASHALQVAIERAVLLARLELDERPTVVSLGLDELLALAVRRARREGAEVAADAKLASEGLAVAVPGSWAERLVADLLHHAGPAPQCAGRAAGDEVELVLELAASGVEQPLADCLVALARACGGALELLADEARLRLPRAASVSAE